VSGLVARTEEVHYPQKMKKRYEDPPIIDVAAEGHFERPQAAQTEKLRRSRETQEGSEGPIVIGRAVEGRFGRRLVVVVLASNPAKIVTSAVAA